MSCSKSSRTSNVSATRLLSCPVKSCKFLHKDWKEVREHAHVVHKVAATPCTLVPCNWKLILESEIKEHHADHHDCDLECCFCNNVYTCHQSLKKHIMDKHANILGMREPLESVDDQYPREEQLTIMKRYFKSPGKIIDKKNYVIVFDEEKNRVSCAFKQLTPGLVRNLKSYERPVFYEMETELPDYFALVEGFNYAGYQAGHFIPAYDCGDSKQALQSTCNIINVGPMTETLNDGPWRALEDFTRKLTEFYNEINYFTIPLYDEGKAEIVAGGFELQIPIAYGKIIFMERTGESTMCQAYILPNINSNHRVHFSKYKVTPERLKSQSNLKFFGIENEPVLMVESGDSNTISNMNILNVPGPSQQAAKMICCPVDGCDFENEDWQVVRDHCWREHETLSAPCKLCNFKLCKNVREHYRCFHDGDRQCTLCSVPQFSSSYGRHVHEMSIHRGLLGLTEPLVPIQDRAPGYDIEAIMSHFYRGPGKIINKNDFLVVFDESTNRVLFAFMSLNPGQLKKFKKLDRNTTEIYSREHELPGYLITTAAIRWMNQTVGHLVAAKDCSYEPEVYESSFSIVNAGCMTTNLNSGEWKQLEIFNRNLAMNCEELNYFSIPIYKGERKLAPGGVYVDVPSAYAKLTYLVKPGEDTTSQAFIMLNSVDKQHKFFLNARVTHDMLQEETQLKFLAVPQTWSRTDQEFHRCTHKGRWKTFVQQDQFKEHERVHAEKFHCHACKKEFDSNDLLTEHKKTHEVECQECHQICESDWELKRHLLTHNDGRTFECDKCDAVFQRKDTLQIHQKRHTKEKGYRCEVQDCNKSFINENDLKTHVRDVHSGQKYPCPVCKYPFSQLRGMQRHLNNKHPEFNRIEPVPRKKKRIKPTVVVSRKKRKSSVK